MQLRLAHAVFCAFLLSAVAAIPARAGLLFDLKWGTSGTGNDQFLNPFDVAVDGTGQVYVLDEDQHRVQKFQADGTFVTSWGDSGGAAGQFSFPKGIAVDAGGNVYVADSNNDRIQKFTGTGTFLLEWGSTGAGDGQFLQPRAIEVGPDGSIYVTEDSFAQKRVQKFTSSGVFVTKWGSVGTGNGQFSGARGIAVDEDGFVYVTDALNDRVQKFTSTGVFVAKWDVAGSGNGEFFIPVGIACRGSSVFIADSGNHRVQELDTDGNYLGQFGSLCRLSDGTGCSDPDGGGPLETGDGQMNGPRGLTLDRLGQLFVVDAGNDRIQRFRDPLVIGVPGDAETGGLRFLAAPNPFRSTVRLVFEIPRATDGPQDARTTARILDIAGREVRRLWDGVLPTGEHRLEWDGQKEAGTPAPAGIYFAVIELEGSPVAAVKIVRTP